MRSSRSGGLGHRLRIAAGTIDERRRNPGSEIVGMVLDEGVDGRPHLRHHPRVLRRRLQCPRVQADHGRLVERRG